MTGIVKDDDDTVYCDIQMPLAQGRELLDLVNALRESKLIHVSEKSLSTCSNSSVSPLISLKIHLPGRLATSKALLEQ